MNNKLFMISTRFEGSKWLPVHNNLIFNTTDPDVSTGMKWHMQSKILRGRRFVNKKPTKPNSSPVALIKPYYE